jgi:hypothetical protein
MDATTICDCHFQDRCATFSDRLIQADRKGPTGLGCVQQTDVHRNQHCHAFRCQSLCAMLASFLSPREGSQPR